MLERIINPTCSYANMLPHHQGKSVSFMTLYERMSVISESLHNIVCYMHIDNITILNTRIKFTTELLGTIFRNLNTFNLDDYSNVATFINI